MKLEIVGILTHDCNLAKRHVAFLTRQLDQLKSKGELSADDQLRLKDIEAHLNSCQLYFETLEPQLKKAIPELTEKIRKLENPNLSAILFERYILLKPLKHIAKEMGLPVNVLYSKHVLARDAYNTQEGIPLYKGPRGRNPYNCFGE